MTDKRKRPDWELLSLTGIRKGRKQKAEEAKQIRFQTGLNTIEDGENIQILTNTTTNLTSTKKLTAAEEIPEFLVNFNHFHVTVRGGG